MDPQAIILPPYLPRVVPIRFDSQQRRLAAVWRMLPQRIKPNLDAISGFLGHHDPEKDPINRTVFDLVRDLNDQYAETTALLYRAMTDLPTRPTRPHLFHVLFSRSEAALELYYQSRLGHRINEPFADLIDEMELIFLIWKGLEVEVNMYTYLVAAWGPNCELGGHMARRVYNEERHKQARDFLLYRVPSGLFSTIGVLRESTRKADLLMDECVLKETMAECIVGSC